MLQKKCNRTQAHYKSGMVPAITHRGVCIRATQTCCGYPVIPESQPEQGWGRPSRTCHTHTAPALGSGSPLRLLLALRHLSFIPGIKAEAPSTGRDTALVTVTILLSKSMKQGHQTRLLACSSARDVPTAALHLVASTLLLQHPQMLLHRNDAIPAHICNSKSETKQGMAAD